MTTRKQTLAATAAILAILTVISIGILGDLEVSLEGDTLLIRIPLRTTTRETSPTSTTTSAPAEDPPIRQPRW